MKSLLNRQAWNFPKTLSQAVAGDGLARKRLHGTVRTSRGSMVVSGSHGPNDHGGKVKAPNETEVEWC